jgi:hypothetical protein
MLGVKNKRFFFVVFIIFNVSIRNLFSFILISSVLEDTRYEVSSKYYYNSKITKIYFLLLNNKIAFMKNYIFFYFG